MSNLQNTLHINFSKLTLQDALDLAILIEEEAKERYKEFADLIGSRYEGDASDFFSQMSLNEEKHRSELAVRREELFNKRPSNVTRDMIWDVEAPNPGEPRPFMSPRQAVKVALKSEIKAHDFFAEALKTITNHDVKALFEELRQEELLHQNMLKNFLDKLPPGEGPDADDDSTDEPSAQ